MTGLIAFILSPLGRVLGIVTLAAGIYTAGFIRGKSRAESRCQAAALRAEIATKSVDLAVARAAAEAAAASLRDEQAAVASHQEKIRDYERALAARPSGACAYGPDDIRRMRSLGR